MRRFFLFLLPILVFATAPALTRAEEETRKKPELAVTRHEVEIGGERVLYEATAGYLELTDEKGKKKADVFHIAYMRQGVDSPEKRPITFCFNGGPGSSSVWLHLGAIGPRRVVMGPEGMPPPPPYRLTPNEFSWLDMTDLVFVDPVTTGYSRAAKDEDAKQFHGLDEDIRSVSDFVRLYVTRNKRWRSPKFLTGESYGTVRASGMADYLQDAFGMYLNGVVLVSPVLNFQTTHFGPGNDLSSWLYLPTYTATAWYHRKLSTDLMEKDIPEVIEEVSAFARGEYVAALVKGDALSPGEREAVAGKLARYTGLPREFILQSNLRIRPSNFRKELLREERRSVGRLDSRFLGIDRFGYRSSPDSDPSMSAIRGPFTATIVDYLSGELGFTRDIVYETLTGKVHPWSFKGHENRYVNVAERLREAMTKNKDLRVLTMSGYYDLATPFFAMDYTAAHMGLDPEIRKNLTATYYRSGHMMYIRQEDLRKMKADAAAFYEAALGGR